MRLDELPDHDPLALLGLSAGDRLVVVVAAPQDDDDGTLSDLLRAVGAADVQVVLVSPGDAPPDGLADDIGVHLTARSSGRRTALLAPWGDDRDLQRRATGRAAGVAARRAGVDFWSYPSASAPGVPGLPADRLRRVGSVLLVTSAPGNADAAWHFDALYEGNDDPWRVRTSWYEVRKRAILMASLPSPRYGLVWEPGCSLGDLTIELAHRADRVVASDVSPRAVAATSRRTSRLGNVEVHEARLPDQPPPMPGRSADLVVLSEVLWYLEPVQRSRALDLTERLVAPGGHVVVVHWRGYPADAHCSGEDANAEVVARLGEPLVHHRDDRFVLDVVRT